MLVGLQKVSLSEIRDLKWYSPYDEKNPKKILLLLFRYCYKSHWAVAFIKFNNWSGGCKEEKSQKKGPELDNYKLSDCVLPWIPQKTSTGRVLIFFN